MKHDLIIIGGGAAGIIAAISAKDLGIDVAILESNDRIGKKLLTTGNGRCNITNKYITNERYHSENSSFFESSLNHFNVEATIDFFYALGLPLVTLEEGKMYPMSLQASSVLDILRLSISEKNIPVYYNCIVKDISPSKNSFKIVTSDSEGYECKKVILATGGKSAPNTGSNGSGYNIAKKLGHKIIQPVPALVQLKLNYKNLKALSGVKFDGVIHIHVDNVDKRSEFGEILFTDYGISGPPILQVSRIASQSLIKNRKVVLKLNMLPNIPVDNLNDFLEGHWSVFSSRSLHDSFVGIINKKIIPILLKEAGITDIHKPCYTLDWKEKQIIKKMLSCWEFEVMDTNSFANSQVTAGGIDTTDVDNETMESKLVPGLYFAGEILDVDGDCGGFNLQWAWSSGHVAGISAANSLNIH